jgi:hypothetical protein
MSSTPQRQKLTSAFTPDAQKKAAEKAAARKTAADVREARDARLGAAIDNLPPATPRPEEPASPLRLVPDGSDSGAAKAVTAQAPATSPADEPAPAPAPSDHETATLSPRVEKPPRPAARRPVRGARSRVVKPPEAEVPYVVYERLRDVAAAEKAENPVAARTHGVIVMDAIERHAAVLAARWTAPMAAEPDPGSLFIRTTPKHGSRHRTRTEPMHPVTLGGVSPENRALIDNLALQWNAGSRAALVEEALRLEFGMPRSDDPAEHRRP